MESSAAIQVATLLVLYSKESSPKDSPGPIVEINVGSSGFLPALTCLDISLKVWPAAGPAVSSEKWAVRDVRKPFATKLPIGLPAPGRKVAIPPIGMLIAIRSRFCAPPAAVSSSKDLDIDLFCFFPLDLRKLLRNCCLRSICLYISPLATAASAEVFAVSFRRGGANTLKLPSPMMKNSSPCSYASAATSPSAKYLFSALAPRRFNTSGLASVRALRLALPVRALPTTAASSSVRLLPDMIWDCEFKESPKLLVDICDPRRRFGYSPEGLPIPESRTEPDGLVRGDAGSSSSWSTTSFLLFGMIRAFSKPLFLKSSRVRQ
mmetsp:Transcript_12269/g.28658  ORF Transcript_12269/g.28658 Transcript_12269/m.28658 type:complete len:321 (-) Transcript_12269:478-1440(-)